MSSQREHGILHSHLQLVVQTVLVGKMRGDVRVLGEQNGVAPLHRPGSSQGQRPVARSVPTSPAINSMSSRCAT
eukprot:3650400-Rhodomonas_salina.2